MFLIFLYFISNLFFHLFLLWFHLFIDALLKFFYWSLLHGDVICCSAIFSSLLRYKWENCIFVYKNLMFLYTYTLWNNKHVKLINITSSYIVVILLCCVCVCSENTWDLPSWQISNTQYSIDNYSHIAVHWVSRTYSFCITELVSLTNFILGVSRKWSGKINNFNLYLLFLIIL